MGREIEEETWIQFIRRGLEYKLFGPPPSDTIGEKIYTVTLKEDTKKITVIYTGRKIKEPKKEKEGD